MRVLHITTSFFPVIGGKQNYIENLCLQLINKGHQSDVLTLNKGRNFKKTLPESEMYRGINIQRVSYRGPERYKFFPRLSKYIEAYDLLHIHDVKDFYNYFAFRKWYHKKPIVVSTHGGFFHTRKYHTIKKIYFRTILPISLRYADKVIAVSDHDYDIFHRICTNTVVVPNGIDFKSFSQINKNIQKNNFLYFGRISKNKRLDNLITTFSYLKKNSCDFRLNIIGPDWEGLQDQLNGMVKNNGIENNVLFIGEVTNDKLLKYLGTAQYFVSASEYEGFGLTVLEAMASGTIPIVNNINPLNGFIRNGTSGFILNFSDPKQASEKILSILQENPQKQKYISKNAKMYAHAFAWETIVEKIEAIYTEILSFLSGEKIYLTTPVSAYPEESQE